MDTNWRYPAEWPPRQHPPDAWHWIPPQQPLFNAPLDPFNFPPLQTSSSESQSLKKDNNIKQPIGPGTRTPIPIMPPINVNLDDDWQPDQTTKKKMIKKAKQEQKIQEAAELISHDKDTAQPDKNTAPTKSAESIKPAEPTKTTFKDTNKAQKNFKNKLPNINRKSEQMTTCPTLGAGVSRLCNIINQNAIPYLGSHLIRPHNRMTRQIFSTHSQRPPITDYMSNNSRFVLRGERGIRVDRDSHEPHMTIEFLLDNEEKTQKALDQLYNDIHSAPHLDKFSDRLTNPAEYLAAQRIDDSLRELDEVSWQAMSAVLHRKRYLIRNGEDEFDATFTLEDYLHNHHRFVSYRSACRQDGIALKSLMDEEARLRTKLVKQANWKLLHDTVPMDFHDQIIHDKDHYNRIEPFANSISPLYWEHLAPEIRDFNKYIEPYRNQLGLQLYRTTKDIRESYAKVKPKIKGRRYLFTSLSNAITNHVQYDQLKKEMTALIEMNKNNDIITPILDYEELIKTITRMNSILRQLNELNPDAVIAGIDKTDGIVADTSGLITHLKNNPKDLEHLPANFKAMTKTIQEDLPKVRTVTSEETRFNINEIEKDDEEDNYCEHDDIIDHDHVESNNSIKEVQRIRRHNRIISKIQRQVNFNNMTTIISTTLTMFIAIWMTQTVDGATTMRNGFVFEDYGIHSVNQDYISLTRRIDFNDIRSTMLHINKQIRDHKSNCETVIKVTNPSNREPLEHLFESTRKDDFIILKEKANPKRARFLCESIGGKLPEIRTKKAARNLGHLMHEANLTTIPAGIFMDSGILQAFFYSDKLKAAGITFPTVCTARNAYWKRIYNEGGKWKQPKPENWRELIEQTRSGNKLQGDHLVYTVQDIDESSYPQVCTTGHAFTMGFVGRNRIICELPLIEGTTYIPEWAKQFKQSCLNTNTNAKENMEIITKKFENLYPPGIKQFNALNDTLIDHNNSRKKRNQPPYDTNDTTTTVSTTTILTQEEDEQLQREKRALFSLIENLHAHIGIRWQTEDQISTTFNGNGNTNYVDATTFGALASHQQRANANIHQGQTINKLQANQERIEMTLLSLQKTMNIAQKAFGLNLVQQDIITADQQFRIKYQEAQDALAQAYTQYETIIYNRDNTQVSLNSITQPELKLVQEALFKENSIVISQDRTRINTEVTKGTHYLFTTLNIPIIDNNKEVEIYKLHPMPIYTGTNSTMTPIIQHEFIAAYINDDNKKIIPMTQDEVHNCMNKNVCSATNPAYNANITPKCGMTAFYGLINEAVDSCNYNQVDKQEPYYKQIGNTTYYSVPKPTELTIECAGKDIRGAGPEQTITIQGAGHIQIAPTCHAHATGIYITPQYHQSLGPEMDSNMQLVMDMQPEVPFIDTPIEFLTQILEEQAIHVNRLVSVFTEHSIWGSMKQWTIIVALTAITLFAIIFLIKTYKACRACKSTICSKKKKSRRHRRRSSSTSNQKATISCDDIPQLSDENDSQHRTSTPITSYRELMNLEPPITPIDNSPSPIYQSMMRPAIPPKRYMYVPGANRPIQRALSQLSHYATESE